MPDETVAAEHTEHAELYRVVDKDGWPERPEDIHAALFADRAVAEQRAREMDRWDAANAPWRIAVYREVNS